MTFNFKENIFSSMLIIATILSAGLILNAVQLVLLVLIKPINKKFFNQLMNFISWSWVSLTVFLIDIWSNSQLILYCSREDYDRMGREHNLLIMNHAYDIDWLVIWWYFEQIQILGCSRAFLKNALKYIPICGWFFWLDDHMFLQRSLEKDKQLIEGHISRYVNYPNPMSIIIPAEGTRFTKEKHEASVKFTQDRNLEPFKHHLLPRAGGFNLCVPLLKKYKYPTVYNLQIAFDKDAPNSPTLGNLFLGKKITAHVFLERIPMDSVEPTFEFLYDVYKRKDALQDSFHKYGNFYEGRGEEKIEGVHMKPQPRVMINFIFWMSFLLSLVIYYSIKLILAGKIFLLIAVGGSIIALIHWMFQIILRQSDSKKSSSKYGKK